MAAPPPAYQPLPAVCGSGMGDDDALLSAACGEAMLPICASASAVIQSGGAGLHSALSDSKSSCGVWYDAINIDRWSRAQIAKETGVTGPISLASAGATYSDAAIEAWCTDHPGSEDCACVAFPQVANAWCSSQEACGLPPDMCGVSEFAQESTLGSGDIELVQFGSCAPYPCWLSDCRGQGNALLTTTLTEAQIFGCPKSMCVQETDGATISINLPRPMPPGSFVVDPMILQCHPTQIRPPLLVMSPLNIELPQNAYLSIPTTLANDGSPQQFASWKVASYGPGVDNPATPWLSLEPDSGDAFLGQTVEIVNWVFDGDQVRAAVGRTWKTDVTIEYSYPTAQGQVTQTLIVPVSLTLTPASQNIVVKKKGFPTSVAVGTGLFGASAIGIFAAIGFGLL